MVRSAGAPSFFYGVESVGVADTMLQQGRSAVARVAAPSAAGKNPDIVLYLLDGATGTMDPAFDAHVLPVKYWALVWWEIWFDHQLLHRVFKMRTAG